MTAFTDEQLGAIERRDTSILLSAGAGTGKTSVLVERFARAVLDDGAEVDAILAITFTDKAAAQLRTRLRDRFVALNARDAARATQGAWISTIHGFCARVLRAHALAAGIDPEFRVLDALETERVAIDAFDRSLGEFLEAGQEEGADRLRLIAAYTPDRLADMVRSAYGHLRSRGQSEPAMPAPRAPQIGAEREELARAVRVALEEIGSAQSVNVDRAREKLTRCEALLVALEAGDVADAVAIKDLAFAGSAHALKGPACEAYRAAHDAYLALCVRHREFLDYMLLRELIDRYHRRFSELKRERSGLDFDDLELKARDLLREDAGLRDHYAERFTHVMVDEFQDTNELQNEILELLARDNLFRVGDERQSIYRFRHADVGVFRRHREVAIEGGRERRIGVNFRSRGEVLDAVDLAFGRLWGHEFDPLREAPGARDASPRVTPSVDLLVADRHPGRWKEHFGADAEHPFGATLGEATPWRAAEARLLARRVEELTKEGPYEFGEVVLLVRATTHISFYERALEERGIPTYVLGGRGYWSQQQVGDLRAYLAALANPLDELALISVLASPLGGLSLDTLVVVKSAARRAGWDLWRMLEAMEGGDEGADRLSRAQAELLFAFVRRMRGERALAPRVSLEKLIDRAVTVSGYDRAVLALPAGTRRMANVRKLMRMAREYEADEGRDLRGFIDFVAERDLVQEREGQAPLEGEDLDAVKLMTIHRAKGLEFPVVCVADLGKGGRDDDAGLRITDDGRVGIRLASLEGGSVASAELDRIKEQGKLDDEEEERRIFYVAATRAQEHLVLSGATDLEKLAGPEPLAEPMRWLWPPLAPDLGARSGRFESTVAYEGREVRVRCEVLRPGSLDELLPAADRDPSRPEPEPAGLEALTAPALGAVDVPDALAVGRLSYSGLESYRRCGYRFYLQRALKLPPHEETTLGAVAEQGLSALARGSIVHELLERLDFATPVAPPVDAVAAVAEAHGEAVTADDIEDLRGLVEAFAGSALCARLGRARRVRSELPFAFTVDAGGRSILMNGVVDVHAEEPDRVLVLDYKSDRLEGRDPTTLVEEAYVTQRLVYALAALRSGAPVVEVTHVFLERPDEPASATFRADESATLEQRLLELASGIVAGRFEPSDAPHRGLCAGCPGRASLCRWDLDRTGAEALELR